MLVKCLALEWGQTGVRVNAISPGPIADTEGMARLASSPEQLRRVERRTPLRRQGRVEEVAQLAVFLASNAASYVSGGIFTCDGGWELGDASADTLAEMRRPTAPAA
jgi:NAD(P)-dependent dehydrogenase (short-subunit alcohol dehydrogenase family)